MDKALTKRINNLWANMELAISEAYRLYEESNNNTGMCLADYVPGLNHAHALDKLLKEETINESAHRRMRPTDLDYAPFPFTSKVGAKLLLLDSFCDGSEDTSMPSAVIFLAWNRQRAEAFTVGYLARNSEMIQWLKTEVRKLDYAKLMQAKVGQ